MRHIGPDVVRLAAIVGRPRVVLMRLVRRARVRLEMYATPGPEADAVPARDRYRGVVQRWRRPTPWALDLLTGTVIVVAGLLTTAGGSDTSPDAYRDFDGIGLVLVLAATLPYYARRRAPTAVFAVSTVSVAIFMLRDYDEGMLPFMLLFGAYTVGAYRGAREVAVSATLMGAALVALLAGDVPDFAAGELVSTAAMFGVAFSVGWTMQSRHRLIEANEKEQLAAAQRAAADERLRIAQELHDVVAHSLGVIAVQAGAGGRVMESDPAEARRSFENIARTSRSALTEIRWLLGEVRNPDGSPAYTPAPGLADLPRLAHQVTDAGLRVDLKVDGDVADVPRGVGLAAYRIVQEALTNALRHADAYRAVVRLTNGSGLLSIDVTDDGRGPNGAPSRGHGLVGMRERVAVYGGSLSVGAGPDGGFRVAASLPYDPERSA